MHVEALVAAREHIRTEDIKELLDLIESRADS
jgi:hypothetical protein